MRIIADLHIHSPYARAVSKEMTLENLDYWARLKGITVIGTGDFTHPAWIKEIKAKLEPAEVGLYVLKSQINHKLQNTNSQTRFMLTVEISSIYSKGGKTRRIHNLIFAPSIETAEKINAALGWQGNLKSDGRPILGLDSKELAKIVFNADFKAVVVPAHAWTPWFSVFGSMSGFDSIEECFDEFAPQIFAIETGLSSDPAMNWRLSKLDKIALISNSDSHSLQRIGREANVFDTELSYDGIIDAIKSHDPRKFLYTIEFYPEEGKYHYDGHRLCKFSCGPEETKKLNKICPRCGKPMTIGVMSRVDQLADRPPGGKSNVVIPYKNLVPLNEIIAESFGVGVASKKVQAEYKNLVEKIGSEFEVLVDAQKSDLGRATLPEIVEGIMRVREGRLHIEPGFDGEYGKVEIFKEGEQKEISQQKSLF
ncbi:MAG: DNA helicase UvrD [Candidatus Sungbacteria bacterium RIFCSPHIGHO2_02_FULL_47_11]|uniref:DNA helicase UvrD n=1 Tax=Candidatus Sungbacteria bacterium RIFCSPHIGHO2_02_FULL_47_11 TaxID=1802270 RepID=A0A1G2KGL9_9BACT|nr:MAG: DNA helicase UvrD [Candidatus Sungbacteria bacterium RIFCSPHIGHO2_02_FULL_47_11]